jgi:GAF domain-containing protein
MILSGNPIGAIAVGRTQAGAFLDKQVTLLQTFADQAVIAIQNVRLFTELQEKNRQLTTALDQQTATSEILRAYIEVADRCSARVQHRCPERPAVCSEVTRPP